MENLFLAVFKISLTTSIVILALIFLGSLINKRYAAKWKYRLWIILALRLIIPINYELPDAQLQVMIPAEVGSQNVSEMFEAESLAATAYTEPLVMDPPTLWPQTVTPLPVESDIREKSQPSITLLQALSYLWMVGVVCLLLWQLTSFFYYKGKLIKSGKAIKNPLLLEELNELCEKLDIRRSITFLTYSKAHSPMVLGFWHPILVLPKEEYSREESFYILKHELIHLRRHDVLVKFLLLLARDFHWFNPVIYFMHREAVVDMEIACDEAVVRGESFNQRKAYTETLMSNLHRQRSRGPLLSTQFSGGVRIMKKRFGNILSKANKKSGAILFGIIFVLTITVGAMVSYAKEEAAPEITPNGTFSENAADEEMSGQSAGGGDIFAPNIEDADGSAAASTLAVGANRETTKTLTVLKEGMEEERSATLYVGEGYSFYLIDEQWVMTDPGFWYAKVNENVRFWINRYEGLNLNQVKEMLVEQGYSVEGEELSGRLYKYEKNTDTVRRVLCYETESDVWTMNSVHSLEGEEGWAVNIRAMFDTFVVTEGYEGRGLSAGKYGDTPKLNYLMFGNVGNLGLGTLAFTVPEKENEDYKLYFFRSENEEDRYLPFSEMSLDPSEASFVFPDVREDNTSIGKFKEIYYIDTIDILKDGIAEIIVIALYEEDGREHYDTRIYEANEKGYVVNDSLTQKLSHIYYLYGKGSYPIYDTIPLPDDSWTEDAQELGKVMTLFYTALFNNDLETIKQCVVEDYRDDIEVLDDISSLDEVEVLGIKGLDSSMQSNIGDKCELSLEFLLPNEDSFTYLLVGFIKEDIGWKIQSYGLEK